MKESLAERKVTMPFFSIISPVYNTSAYLNKFLDTVINQGFSDFELILVDDGSTDDSLKICRESAEKDNRIAVITQQNQGAGAARNRGIEKAKGEYLLFFDSDDYVDTSALETLHYALKDRSPEILIFGAKWVSFSGSEEETAKTELIPEKLELNTERECRDKFCTLMFSSVLNPPWNKAYRRDFIMSNKLRFSDTRRAQDAFFNMDCFRKLKSLYTISDALYYYRENTRKKVWKKFPKDLYKIDIKYNSTLEEICREFGLYSGENREKVDAWFFNSIMRTAGFFRNPLWKLSQKEKREYVSMIINDPYNIQRAKASPAADQRTAAIKKFILENDADGLMRFIKKTNRRESLYEWYRRGPRKLLKGS